MIDYANLQLNWSLEKASFLATIHGICQIVGVLIILPLSDLLGRKKTVIISNGTIAVCLMGLLLVGNSWIPVYGLIGCIGAFYGATWPIYGACAGDYFPSDKIGTVVGAWTPFYGLGAILTHWVSGILRDTTGIYNHAFFISALAGGLALMLMVFVKKNPPKENA
jgi:MFS family permease